VLRVARPRFLGDGVLAWREYGGVIDSARTQRSLARGGPTHRLLRLSHLNGCHPRPVNAHEAKGPLNRGWMDRSSWVVIILVGLNQDAGRATWTYCPKVGGPDGRGSAGRVVFPDIATTVSACGGQEGVKGRRRGPAEVWRGR